MSLPKLQTPEYSLVVPSTGEEIKYRPFLVKEEKLLLIALESEEQNQINTAIQNLVKGCTFNKIGQKDTPIFDIEFSFLKIRSKSVGENSTISMTCPDDGKTKVDVNINYDDVEVQMTEDHSTEVKITDEITLVMRYPTLNDAMTESKDDISDTEQVFKMVRDCMFEVHHNDDITNMIDVTNKEKEAFMGDMTSEQFTSIQVFFDTMPKLRHVIEFKNPKTKKKNEVLLEGLADFFD